MWLCLLICQNICPKKPKYTYIYIYIYIYVENLVEEAGHQGRVLHHVGHLWSGFPCLGPQKILQGNPEPAKLQCKLSQASAKQLGGKLPSRRRELQDKPPPRGSAKSLPELPPSSLP